MLLMEKPFKSGESLRKGYNLDIQAEIKLVENFKSKLRMQSSNDKLEKKKMKELGLKRFGNINIHII